MTEHTLRAKIYEKFKDRLYDVTTKTAYLEDVQEAIGQAYKNFVARREGEFSQNFEAGTVTVMFHQDGKRWDYGHPAMYRLEVGHVAELTAWWQEVAPAGWIMPAQYKSDLKCYEINVQAESPSGRLFNYHVALIELVEK